MLRACKVKMKIKGHVPENVACTAYPIQFQQIEQGISHFIFRNITSDRNHLFSFGLG